MRADSKYVEVWHAGGIALTEESLRAIEERLPETFLRVHRNALVSPSRIRALQRDAAGKLLLDVEGCSEPIEVSRRHAPEVRALLRSGVDARRVGAEKFVVLAEPMTRLRRC